MEPTAEVCAPIGNRARDLSGYGMMLPLTEAHQPGLELTHLLNKVSPLSPTSLQLPTPRALKITILLSFSKSLSLST